MNSFPQMLMRMPGSEPMHGLGSFASMIVHDEATRDAALADGWHETTTEAKAAYLAEQEAAKLGSAQATDDASKPPTRAELEQKAAELGVEFDGRIGDKKLAERIAAKLAS